MDCKFLIVCLMISREVCEKIIFTHLKIVYDVYLLPFASLVSWNMCIMDLILCVLKWNKQLFSHNILIGWCGAGVAFFPSGFVIHHFLIYEILHTNMRRFYCRLLWIRLYLLPELVRIVALKRRHHNRKKKIESSMWNVWLLFTFRVFI